EGVRLSWRRPMNYTSGKSMRDLQGFDIERATGADGVAYANVGNFELTDQTRFRKERVIDFTDTTAQAGATYRYRIVAYTIDHYSSAPSESVPITHRVPPAHPTPGNAPADGRAPRPGMRRCRGCGGEVQAISAARWVAAGVRGDARGP